jgi:regulatory protein
MDYTTSDDTAQAAPRAFKGGQQLSLKGRALRALAAREYSRAELERKLAAFEEAPGDLARALDDLAAKGFIDEQRVADSLVHRRGSKLGAARVLQELKAKGVEPGAIAQATEQLRTTEYERAHEVWRKKFGEVATNPSDKARQMRFLATRGFTGDVIRRVMVQD